MPVLNWLARLLTKAESKGYTSMFDNIVGSVAGKYLGTNLTGAEREANEWTAQREDTFHQRTVADMKAAGLNPALMYGNGASGASPSQSVAPGSADPVSLAQLATLPAQLKQINAQTANIKADADLKRTETEYKKSLTGYQNLLNQFLPERNAAEVAGLWSIPDLNKASAALSWANTAYRNKENEYFDLFAQMKLAVEEAQKNDFQNSADLKKVQELFTEIQRAYAASTGLLMSSSERIALAEYIAGLFGISRDDVKTALPAVGKRLDDAAADYKHRKESEKRSKAAKKKGYGPVMRGSESGAPKAGSR